ncbi:Lipase Member N [Manis pentadactyla]|nr:Lipase Member N [Manis pentadactyla]
MTRTSYVFTSSSPGVQMCPPLTILPRNQHHQHRHSGVPHTAYAMCAEGGSWHLPRAMPSGQTSGLTYGPGPSVLGQLTSASSAQNRKSQGPRLSQQE